MAKYLIWADNESGDHYPIGLMDHKPTKEEEAILTSKAFVGDDGWDAFGDNNDPEDATVYLQIHEIEQIDLDNPPFKY
jgi:hypothetical protein